MTPQQKMLWEKITKDVRNLGGGNLQAREIYDEIIKLMEIKDKVLISIVAREDGLEVKVAEDAYGNLGVVGLLERIKLNILAELAEEKEMIPSVENKPTQKYDA